MSQENVEAWRASIEDLRAANSESDRDAWLPGMAELWDPEIEIDAAEAAALDLSRHPLRRRRQHQRAP